MTTSPASGMPPDDLVELASAALDGALAPHDEAAALENPQVSALVRRFAAVRSHLGSPAPADPDLRERHVLAALAEFSVGDTESSVPSVSSLEAARARRARRLAPVLAAAAAVAVIGLVAGVAANRGSGRDTVTADASSAEIAATSNTAELARTGTVDTPEAGAPAAESASESPMSAMVSPAADSNDSGSTADNTALIGETPNDIPGIAKAALDLRAAKRSTAPTHPCTSARGEAIASITWKAQSALLFVAPSADAPTDAFVVDASTCTVIASATLGS
jgi:hypothetical protein